ncbi:hypothetical protein BaRGS_00040571 [Batillaria attramentaria]|uniref:Tc1-like transposase DDE domain-containing protein n=1 Tax=Batillaria attramentaria TaxID=370345 RepID=A0ABD0IZR9_9CAEN
MVWGCISHDCKLDLVTIRGNLTGYHYIREVLQPAVVPHFDAHPLATRPVFMDDNARPHRSRAARGGDNITMACHECGPQSAGACMRLAWPSNTVTGPSCAKSP